jgi:hypothetical protein
MFSGDRCHRAHFPAAVAIITTQRSAATFDTCGNTSARARVTALADWVHFLTSHFCFVEKVSISVDHPESVDQCRSVSITRKVSISVDQSRSESISVDQCRSESIRVDQCRSVSITRKSSTGGVETAARMETLKMVTKPCGKGSNRFLEFFFQFSRKRICFGRWALGHIRIRAQGLPDISSKMELSATDGNSKKIPRLLLLGTDFGQGT